MGELKPAAIGAAVGFVLSFLIGLISGVRFGHVCLRALALAVICGGLFFLLSIIFKKYLPELFTDSENEKPTDKEVGNNLDIVIDEDEQPADNKSGEQAFSDTASNTDEVSPKKSPLRESIQTPQLLSTETDFSTLAGDGVSSTAASSQDNDSTLEELPDMSQFENPLESSVGEITSDLVDAGTDSVKKDNSGEFGTNNAKDMAKAIQTILKKEST